VQRPRQQRPLALQNVQRQGMAVEQLWVQKGWAIVAEEVGMLGELPEGVRREMWQGRVVQPCAEAISPACQQRSNSQSAHLKALQPSMLLPPLCPSVVPAATQQQLDHITLQQPTHLKALQLRMVLPPFCQRQQRCKCLGSGHNAAQRGKALAQQGGGVKQVGQPVGGCESTVLRGKNVCRTATVLRQHAGASGRLANLHDGLGHQRHFAAMLRPMPQHGSELLLMFQLTTPAHWLAVFLSNPPGHVQQQGRLEQPCMGAPRQAAHQLLQRRMLLGRNTCQGQHSRLLLVGLLLLRWAAGRLPAFPQHL